MKKTLVLGASIKPDRYSNLVIYSLVSGDNEVIGIGSRAGNVDGVEIHKGFPLIENIHTVTIYLNAKRQEMYYDYIIALRPRRVIFNPGTKNSSFEKLLEQAGIFFESACTMVLLSTDQY
ncbi:MAG: CoA-binding protein [Flavobacteriaceae bacterium]|nr:CoA-binding protein [Flavobacteriaceae bacterium]